MKRIWLGILLMVLLTAQALPAWAAPNVQVTARAAYEGRVKPGAWTTIIVDLVNQGGEMEAELVVEPSDGPWSSRPQYVVPVSLPAGGRKRVPVDLPLNGVGQVQVKLTSGRDVIYEEKLMLTSISPETMFIGVLSDDELGLPALSRLGEGGKGFTAQVARIEPEAFPARGALLQQFDVIAISRFDSSKLSQEQLQALQTWVGRGGMLVLTGGPEWRRTLQPLPASLVPVEVAEVKDVPLSPLGDLIARPLPGTGPVSAGRVRSGRTMVSSGDTPLLVLSQVGSGQVLFLAADPGLEPMASWAGQTDLFGRYLRQGTGWNPFQNTNPDGDLQYALQRIPGLGLPGPGIVAALVVAYLLLIGPINYWVLKRMDRREWAWVSIPLISTLFVASLYGLSMGKRTSLISHVITVTEMAAGTTTGTMTSYVGVYAPTRNQLDVSLENARLVRPLQFYGRMGVSEVSARVVAGDKTRVELLGMNNYTMRGFAAEQDITLQGGLELVEAKTDDQGVVTARVANRLDQPVTDVMVGAGNQWARFPRLEPGATSEPFTLNLNLLVDQMKGGIFIDQGIRVFPGQSQTDRMTEIRRQQVRNSIVYQSQYGINAGNAIMLTAFTERPVAQPVVPEMGSQFMETHMIYARLPVPVDYASGDIPPGVITPVLSSNNAGRTPFGYILPQGTHGLTFTLPPLDAAKVAEIRLHIASMSGNYTIEVKNQKTSEWVQLLNADMQTLENWPDFVSASGQIDVQLQVRDHLELSMPSVSVKGVDR